MRAPSEMEKAAAGGTATTLDTAHVADSITVLETDVSVAYRYQSACYDLKNGSVAESGLEYSSREIAVSSLMDVQSVFAELHKNPRAIAVMGRAPTGRVKLSDQFEDSLSHVAIFEISLGGKLPDIESAIQAMRGTLPKQFHDADCVWSIAPQKEPANFQRAYLAFWMPEPMTLKDQAALVKRERCAQYQEGRLPAPGRILHLARPTFAEGVTDPFDVRQGYCSDNDTPLSYSPAEGYTPRTVTICTAQKQDNQVRFKTKVFGLRDGKLMKIDIPRPFLYTVELKHPANLKEFSDLRRSLEGDPTKLSVLGAFVGDTQATFEKNKSVRLTAGRGDGSPTNFVDREVAFVTFDIDRFQPFAFDPVTEPVGAITEWVAAALPDCFLGRSFDWALSSSAGLVYWEADKDTGEIKKKDTRGTLKAHVTFEIETPYMNTVLKAWAVGINHAKGEQLIDSTVFGTVQPHFIAGPVFLDQDDCENPDLDPLKGLPRSGYYPGPAGATVPLVIDPSVLPNRQGDRGEKKTWEQTDLEKKSKQGVIGAWFRAFTNEDVVTDGDLLGDFFYMTNDHEHFDLVGATPGACFLRGDCFIGCGNDTWSANFKNIVEDTWEVARVLKFGHLDHEDGAEEDFETLGISRSAVAMAEWAAGLDEVKKELAAESQREQESRAEIVEELLQRIAAADTPLILNIEVLPAIKAAIAEHGFQPYEAVELENTFAKRFTALSPSKAKLGVKERREMFMPEQDEASRIFDLEMSLVNQVLGDWFGKGKHLKFFGGCWWIYRHGVWQQTESSLVENRVQRTIQRILSGDVKGSRELTKLLRESERGDYLNALTSAVFGNLRRHCSKDDQASDPLNLRGQHPDSVINCRNGELWFDEEGNIEFLAHDPAHKLTHQIATDYDPGADCPKFKAAMALAFSKCSQPEEVIRHFLELMGTIIQPRRVEAMWTLFKGRGENGKTFLVDIVEAVMGSDSCLKGSVADAASGKDNHFTASLIGKLAFIDDDVKQGALLPDDWLKKLSEEKVLTANPKNAGTFQFTSRATMVMLANHWPRTVDTSFGMTRRAHVFEFKHQLTEDEKKPGLKRYIIENELPGVLNLLIDGWRRVLARGRYQRPAEIVAAGDRWIRSANTTGNFFRQMLMLNPKAPALKLTTVERFYHSWMAEHEPRATPLGKQAFIQALQNMGVDVFTQHNQHHVRGVSINPLPSDDVPADYIADGVAEAEAEAEADKLYAKTFGGLSEPEDDFAD